MDLRYLYIAVIFVCLCSGFVIANEIINPNTIKPIDSFFNKDSLTLVYDNEIEITPYLNEKTPYTDFDWEINTKEVYDEKSDKTILEETKAFYPVPKNPLVDLKEFHWLVNKLQTEKTCVQTNPYYQTCSHEELDFSTFESKNEITNKTIKENKDKNGTILSYLISYYGIIIDLDPVLNLVIDGASDLIFTNRTEGSSHGARLSAPVLFMDFNKPPENLTASDPDYDDYVQDNSIYNNYGLSGAGTNSNHAPTYNSSCTAFTGSGGCYEFDGVDDYFETTLTETKTSYAFWYANASDGIWTHIVNSSGTTYVNGATGTLAVYPIYVSGNTIQVGKTGTSSYYNGSIDNIQIWDRALSADEISALYSDASFIGKYSKSGDFKSLVFYNDTSVYWNTTLNFANSSGQGVDLTDANLVSYWALDENYLDSKGSNHGTATNHPKNSTGLSSDAMLFDGVDDYVETSLSTNLDGSGDFTASAWVKMSSSQSYALGQSHAISPYASDWFFPYENLVKIFWMRSVTLGNMNTINDNQWHYLAMVWNKSAETYEGFVDGSSIGTSGVVSGYGGVGNIVIGARPDKTTTFFNGSIDEVLIYNDTLTNAEVMDLYKTGLSQHADTNISLKTRTATSYNLTDTGLVSQWSFNNDYTDDKGANDGTNSGTERNEGNGTVGQGLYFDGADSITISSMDLETSQCWWNNSGSGWSHYCNSSGTTYIDGVASSFTFNILSVSGSDLLIGNGYTGSIDEVRIYNRSLSASEITDLYELGEKYILWNSWSDEGVMGDGIHDESSDAGKFFQFKAVFDSNDSEVSAYLFNQSVESGNLPAGAITMDALVDQTVYYTHSFSYDVDATGSSIHYFINDTSTFSIDETTGVITNNSALTIDTYYTLNVSANNSLGSYDSGILNINATSIQSVEGCRSFKIKNIFSKEVLFEIDCHGNMELFGKAIFKGNVDIEGDLNVTGNYIHGANTGLTGNYSVGDCWTAYSGGIIYDTNCTAY